MIPNLLTLARIFSIPMITICFYIESSKARWCAVILYIAACITDFLDGYFARQWSQVSNFGKFMDPVADKLLISITILMLSGFGVIKGIHLLAAVIILAREVLVSGLRSYMSQIQQVIPVTKYAKWKTAIQMISIAFLLSYFASRNLIIGAAGLLSLWLAAILTAVTGWRYMRLGNKLMHFKN